MRQPFVSVIVPSFNQGEFIERTILSVLRQDYPGGFELIISDGGSKDRTVEVLKKYSDKLTWWSEKDKGFADAVQKGVRIARGELLAIQSSDDYYLKDAFARLAAGFHKHPAAGFISGRDLGVDLKGKILWSRRQSGEITPRNVLFGHSIGQHATFIRRDVYEKAGGVRPDVDMCADMDLWYRASHFAPGHFITSYTGVYQVQPAQRTQTSDKFYSSLTKMVELCESAPGYAERFRLTPAEKRDLFMFWRLAFTASHNKAAAEELAAANLGELRSYGPRTRALLLKLSGKKLGHALQLLRNGGLPGVAASRLLSPVSARDLNWWKN